jgi:MoaA/NifB/PqqE/SkfB family radical SAM enzyme
MTNILNKALELPKYMKAIRNRELLRMPVYITERCNSRCKTCRIWAKKDPKDMPIWMLERVLDNEAFIVLQGGEPIIHPDIGTILGLLRKRGVGYQLFSNGILAEKLVGLVEEYGVPNVALSCDGGREAYKRARGVDNFGNIVRLLGELAGRTNLELSFIVSPWNTRGDLLEVARLAKQFGAVFHVDVYDEISYFGTTAPRLREIYRADDAVSFPNSKCLKLYNRWLKGDIELPCYSVKFSCFITTDGTVYSCGRKLVPLGSLRRRNLREIWDSPKTAEIQDGLSRNCNGCFATCYRNIDVAFASVFPKFVLGRLL